MNAEEIIRVYRVIEQMYHEGLVRSIGVANFAPEQLEILMDTADIVPTANQFRFNPAARNLETVEFCNRNGILPIAHSPMNFTVKAFTTSTDLAAEYRTLAGDIGKNMGKDENRYFSAIISSSVSALLRRHMSQNSRSRISIFLILN